MEMRQLGKTGLKVSVLGLGGSEIGYEGPALETVKQLINSALDQGLNVIDTAECYNISEELIGKAVAHRRKDFFLFTKTGHAAGIDLPDWDPRLIAAQIDRSLQRLQTDRVDLLQLHSCSLELLQQGDVIAAVQKIRDAGKTRFIGYSGDKEAAAYAITCGAFDTLQTSINIFDQSPLDTNLPLAKKHNLGVICKRPIGNAVWRHATKPADSFVHKYWDRCQILKYDFASDSDLVADTALRFTLSQPGVCVAIVGTKNPAHWKKNAAALANGPLPAAEDRGDSGPVERGRGAVAGVRIGFRFQVSREWWADGHGRSSGHASIAKSPHRQIPSPQLFQLSDDLLGGLDDVGDAGGAGLALDDQRAAETNALECGQEGGPVDLAFADGHFLAPGAGDLRAFGVLDVNLADGAGQRGHGLHRIALVIKDHVAGIEIDADARVVEVAEKLVE